jgi:zinc protease
LIPEINYKTSGMQYELLGIENQNGTDMYVVKLNDGENDIYDYYHTQTYSKIKRLTISSDPEAGGDAVVTYADYKAVNGILFPHKIVLSFGEVAFSGTVKGITVNKGSIGDYK